MRLVTVDPARASDHGEAGALVEAAARWLDEHAAACLAPLLALEGGAGTTVVAIDEAVEGVAVLLPNGTCCLDATREDVARSLLAELSGWRSVLKIVCAGELKRPAREAMRLLEREHDLLAMVCDGPAGDRAGRWAVPADRAALERYQELYNQERRTAAHPDFGARIRERAVAVLEQAGELASVVQVNGRSTRFAALGGTFTFPPHRRRGLAGRLTSFVCAALAAEGRKAHLIVDDDNAAAIALYRQVGFRPVGTCYMAYASRGRSRGEGTP